MLIDSGFVTSSFRVSGSYAQTGNAVITGSLNVTAGITGSLFGTSSHAITASFFGGAITSASYASSSTSASYALNAGNAISSSFATNANSASYALNAGNTQTASFATNANSSSYALNAGNAQSASFATNASNAFIQSGNSFGVAAVLGTNDSQSLQFETSGSIRMTISGSGPIGIGTTTPTLALLQVQGNVSASSYSGSLLGTASFAINTNSSSYALNAGTTISSSFSTNAGSASYALNAGTTISSSFSTNAGSASYALNAGNAQSSSFATTASSADNFTVRNTLTATTIVVQTITSSVDFVTGSTRFGTLASNTHVFTGSVSISGSLIVQGAISGSNITGSLLGTASYANNALSSSYAVNAGTTISASFSTNAGSASYALNAGNTQTASFATNTNSASYALNAGNAQTASFATNVANAFIQNGNSFGAAALLGTNDAQNLQFETNGTVRMTISGSGPIGIGTATPTLALLQIQGNVSASSYTGSLLGTASFATSASWAPAGAAAAGTSNFIATGSVSASLDVAATQIFRLISGSSTFIQVSSSGVVGIGTTAPQSRLTVYDINNTFPLTAGGNSATPNVVALGTVSSVPSINGYSFNFGATTNLALQPNGGNVGVGITAPTGRLHISGSTNSMLRIESQDNSDSVPIVYIEGNKGGSAPATAVLIELRSNIDVRGRGINMTTADSNARWFAGVSYNNGTTSGYQIGYDATANRLPFYSQSSSLFINTSGNVGIGTTAPGALLDVNGTAAAKFFGGSGSIPSYGQFEAYMISSNATFGNNYAYYSLHRGGAVDWQIGMISSSFVIARGGGASQYTLWTDRPFAIDTSNNVGIGTITPNQKLDVIGRLKFRASGASSPGHWITDNAGSENVFVGLQGTTSTDAFGVYSNADWRFTILNGGNVGIGTQTPASKLDVNGIIFAGSTSATEGTIILQDQYTVGHLTNFGTNRSSGGPVIGYGVYPSTVTTNAFISSTAITASRTAFSMDSEFRWYTGGSQFPSIGSAATLSQRMTLDNNGNLGIGATLPGSRFEIKSSATNNLGGLLLRATSTSNFPALLYENSTNGGVLDLYSNATLNSRISANGDSYISASSGNFGIGTASPAAKLEVVGTSRVTQNAAAFQLYGINHTYIEFYPTASAGRQSYFGFPSVGSRQLTLANEATNGDIILLPGGSGGYVGIGTTTPYEKLEVAGAISAGGGWTGNSSQGAVTTMGYQSGYGFIQAVDWGVAYQPLMLNPNGGNVGVGTVSSAAILHVSGAAAVNPVIIEGGASNWNETTPGTSRGTLHLDPSPSSANIGNAITFGAHDSSAGTIAQAGIYVRSDGSYGTKMYIATTDSYAAGAKTRIFVNSTGNVGINTLTTTYTFNISGDAYVGAGALGVNVAPNATDGRIDASNDIVAYSSDKRLKTNIQFIENPLDKIGKLKGFTYNWNDKAKELAKYNTKESLVGVFAQDVQEVLPEAVKLAPFDNDGTDKSISGENYLTVQYEKIVPLLIEAVKEQQKQIDELKYLLQNKQ